MTCNQLVQKSREGCKIDFLVSIMSVQLFNHPNYIFTELTNAENFKETHILELIFNQNRHDTVNDKTRPLSC